MHPLVTNYLLRTQHTEFIQSNVCKKNKIKYNDRVFDHGKVFTNIFTFCRESLCSCFNIAS
jgi:hypothetical protein